MALELVSKNSPPFHQYPNHQSVNRFTASLTAHNKPASTRIESVVLHGNYTRWDGLWIILKPEDLRNLSKFPPIMAQDHLHQKQQITYAVQFFIGSKFGIHGNFSYCLFFWNFLELPTSNFRIRELCMQSCFMVAANFEKNSDICRFLENQNSRLTKYIIHLTCQLLENPAKHMQVLVKLEKKSSEYQGTDAHHMVLRDSQKLTA